MGLAIEARTRTFLVLAIITAGEEEQKKKKKKS